VNLKGRNRWASALLGTVITIALLRAVGPNVLQTTQASPRTQQASNADAVENPWLPWSAKGVDDQLREGRPVFVDFTAAWCITCQYNKQTTLAKAEVLQDFASKQVTLMRADWTRRDPEITRALSALGRSGVPVYVLYQAGKAPVVMSEILSASAIHTALSAL
jgi:thiol:disulfide interchange protein